MITIRQATFDDLDVLHSIKEEPPEYFERCLAEQAEGRRDLFIASNADGGVGFVMLNRFPRYQPFKKMRVPEIQDLYVRPECRKKGIATTLIEHCEAKAKQDGSVMIGLGVVVNRDYGAAQRLYIKQGYMPDGHGAVYDRQVVTPGDVRSIDDELCLMFVKEL